jgi:DAK2 domain fusion protein YloV
MHIAYVDGPRFRRSLLAACEYAQRGRQELNRINVFPVPDGDTGTNLALTVRTISERLRDSTEASVGGVAREAARASILGARGNVGMMLSHFLLGFAERVGEQERLSVGEFSEAMGAGVQSLHDALDQPVEGTMLTVMRETAEAAQRSDVADFLPWLSVLLEAARRSLSRTPDLLPVLKRAGVVDAGAKGFVSLLEGVVLFVHGDPLLEAESTPFGDSEPAVLDVEFPEAAERFRFCTEAMVRGTGLPESRVVREALKDHGDSLIVLRSQGLLKVHIHTDDPDSVFTYLRALGEITARKAEDMAVQHETVERAVSGGHIMMARRPVSVVTDSAADLPDDIVRQHGIHVVPLMLMNGERALRDGVDITADEYHRMLREGEPLPTTSQPPPGAFLAAMDRAAEDGESIVVVALGSSLSGTFASAEAAAQRFEGANVHVVDSRGASSLQALLALKAAELGEAGLPAPEIVQELRRLRSQSGIFFTVDSFDRLLASGRVGKGRAWLGSLLSVKPILGLTLEGKVVPSGKALGRERVLGAVLGLLSEKIPSGAERVRFALAHVACPELAEQARDALRERFGAVDVMVAPATPVVATHTGVGAWAVAYMIED